MGPLTPGWKTSEAHITFLTIVGSFVLSRWGLSEDCKNEVVGKVVPFLSAGLASAGYAISRAVTKLRK